MGLSKFIWWMNVMISYESLIVMPSGARICECHDGSVFITYPDGVKRWMAKDWFDEIDTDKL